MTTDDATELVNRYRASVDDLPTPNVDQLIKAAAARQAAKRRLLRRSGGTFFVTAVTALAIGAAWHARQPNVDRSTALVTHYGRIEGLTRPYLLQVATTPYAGPGVDAGAQ